MTMRELLIEARKKSGLSQKTLAEKIGQPRGTVDRMEGEGKRGNATVRAIDAWMEACGVALVVSNGNDAEPEKELDPIEIGETRVDSGGVAWMLVLAIGDGFTARTPEGESRWFDEPSWRGMAIGA